MLVRYDRPPDPPLTAEQAAWASGLLREKGVVDVTPDDEAFVRAIVAAPGDDLPRLVYADWLDDRGDPRGAYLRAEAAWATPWKDDTRPADDPRLASDGGWARPGLGGPCQPAAGRGVLRCMSVSR